MIRYNRTAFLKFDSEINGNAFVRGPVTVQFAGLTSLAPLFQDELGEVPKDNPVQTDDNGQYFFYIANGDYDIFINKGNVGATSILDETIAQPAVIAANEVVINSETDFPAPVAGVITQQDNVVWVIGSTITTSNRFVLGADSLVTSNNSQSPVLTYTGTGTMFTGSEVSSTIKDIRVSCPNAQFIEMSASAVFDASIIIDTVIINGCTKFATFDDMFVVDIINSAVLAGDDGMTLTGVTNWGAVSIDKFLFFTPSATCIGIDFNTSLHRTVILSSFSFNGVPGSIGLDGATNSANLRVGSLANVTLSEFLGGVTALSGINESDIRWDFQSNAGVPDSQSFGLLSIDNNATPTTTPLNTPVKMAGTWVTELVSHFTADGTGSLIFTGEIDESLAIDIALTMLMVSGASDKQVSGYAALNGTEVTQTRRPGTATNTKAASVNIVWDHVFTEGDKLDVFIENNSDSVNIIGQGGVSRVK